MRTTLRLFMIGVLTLGVGMSCGVLSAQDTTARISGTVTDSSGAVVPNATIAIVSKERGATVATVKTDGQGAFVAASIPPGDYKVTAVAPTFEKTELDDVTATIAQRLTLNIKLTPGAVAAEVVVTGTQEQLDTDNPTVSTILTPSDVQDLPLPNRSILTLTALVPGVTHGGTYTNVNNAQITFNGSRVLNENTLLDGQSVIENVTSQIATLPSPDGLSQVRVLTSNAPAEYGRTSGAVISLATRSGTNDFHGGLYFLFRNEDMDANNYFNNLKGIPRSRDRYDQFGGTIGGPIRIPHLYNGRDHAFFFFNYDQTLQLAASTATTTVPNAAYRVGNFSALPSTNVIIDPTTGMPFPGNMIPANRIDPSAAAVIAMLPLPNLPGIPDANDARTTNNYTSTQNLNQTHPRYTGRIDYSINDRTRFFASTNRWKDNTPNFILFSPQLTTATEGSFLHGWESVVSMTHDFTPKTVLNLNFGLNRWVQLGTPDSTTNTLGIESLPTSLAPSIATSGWASVGFSPGSEKLSYSNTYNTFGSLTKVWGNHFFNFGGILRKDEYDSSEPSGAFNGQISFTGEITSQGHNTTGADPAAAWADFLLGAIKTASYQLPQPKTGRRNYNLAFYGQDDWKVTHSLTINAGVRWEYESPMYINNNVYSRFDANTGAFLIAGKNATKTLNITTPKLDFMPRVGLEYSPVHNTVFRAGFGTYYGEIMSNFGDAVSYPGFAEVQNFNNLGTGVAQPFTLHQGLPLIAPPITNPASILATASDTNPYAPGLSFQQVSPMQMVEQWNVGIQQQVFSNTVFELNYIGNRGVHLPLFLPADLPNPADATAIAYANTTQAKQDAQQFNYLASWPTVQDVGISNYNALQVSVKRQFHSQLAILSNYTWSHSLDDGSGIFPFSQATGLSSGQYPADPTYRRQHDYSDSAYDVRNSAAIAMIYQTKGPVWLRDFAIGPVFVTQSGFPLTVTQSSLFPGVGLLSNQRPNGTTNGLKLANRYFVGQAIQYLAPPPTTATAATQQASYQLQPSGPYFANIGSPAVRTQLVATGLGDVGRYTIPGVGNWDLDLGVTRTFHIWENVNASLRVDAFNVLNHTNLAQPGTSLTVANLPTAPYTPYFNSPSFGQITGALQSRQLQLIARINF